MRSENFVERAQEQILIDLAAPSIATATEYYHHEIPLPVLLGEPMKIGVFRFE